ncbi:oxidoreductase [Streptomyces radicis]|uniref:SDR family NAD(P)-dependent oxidoreductase n=1 Tax=Streptomyces radicis TaxID=1750517 RepID=A0A3A9WR10_9ACTN|nr:oxidoreductase [Streptomyces radicis]RKN11954.1 SDR family NAD(P)-dependent oxidoreductase [Streptomyces radicis]RKN25995.1 SDR family NAD(P)-dependent oxidoreductase [Streptomyces radicis]
MGWTVRDIPDLKGRTAVVTGAGSGLGYVTARELARRGARTVLACRSQRSGQDALERLFGEVPEARAEMQLLDLADLASVRAFALEWGDRRLDLLINNAGLMAVPYAETADGFEMHFGVNHLGHFALTGLLLDRLVASPGSRVVTVSSLLHLIADVDLRDLNSQRRYRRWVAYGRSRTANLLFTHELARRLRGRDVVAVAVHPGWADPGPPARGRRGRPTRLAHRLVAAPPEVGATPSLYAATAPAIAPDSFTGPSVLGARTPRGGPGGPWRAPWTRNARTAAHLWRASEELTGVRWEG